MPFLAVYKMTIIQGIISCELFVYFVIKTKKKKKKRTFRMTITGLMILS